MAPKTLVTGISGEAVVVVTADNIADKFGNAGAKVFATPMLVALIEQAAINTVKHYLPEGEGTVGTKVDIAHLAATPVGMSVRATAKLVEIAGKKLVFDIEAFDDREKVGQGRHERYIINTESFLGKVTAKV
jgi:fluoroacetyl-CoA thioesterase